MQITSFFVIKCLGLCAWVNEHPAYIIKKSAGSRLTPSGDMIPKLQIISIGNSGILTADKKHVPTLHHASVETLHVQTLHATSLRVKSPP